MQADKQYFKPHFGPEETREVIQRMHEEEQKKV